MISFLLISALLGAPETLPPEYELYVEETSPRILPLLTTSVGYAIDLNDSFSDLHSIVGEAQIRVWKYLSTGIFYQHIFPQLSSAGSRLKALEPTLKVSVGQPLWGVFSLTQLQLILGQWNVMNLFPLQADFMIGGGLGMLNRRSDISADAKNSLSYLWSVEQRFRIFNHAGIFVSLFGHTGSSFLSVGANASF